MLRMRLPKSKPGLALLVAVALLVANAVAVRATSAPLEALSAKAEELHDGAGPLPMIDGGYGAGVLGMWAEGSFDAGEDVVLEVELRRACAFVPWRVVEWSRRVPGR